MTLSIDISHDFGGFALDVEFSAAAGVTALFGRSGAGKTSVVNAISGLFTPDRGRILFGDDVLFDAGAPVGMSVGMPVNMPVNMPVHKRRIGLVFQDGRLFPHLDVAQNLDFGAQFAKGVTVPADKARIIEMLGLGGLLGRRPATLSGGEQQRVALGRALLSRPRLLLMDEPLAALDGPRKEEILPYLERLRDNAQMPIIYVSHAVDEIARLADNLVLMENGRVVRSGNALKVFADPAAAPILGVREAGAVLLAQVIEHAEDGLSRLRTSGGDLLVPGVGASIGQQVRIRVLAQDIILSVNAPVGLSTRNALPVTITEIRLGDGLGAAIVLQSGTDRLLARVTVRAVADLGLHTGLSIFALIKATAIPRGNIGGASR